MNGENIFTGIDMDRLARVRWWEKILVRIFGKRYKAIDSVQGEYTVIVTAAKMGDRWYIIGEEIL